MDNSFDINTVSFRHELPIQVRFNDVDILGHVNNSVVISYFDLGKVAYFEALGHRNVRTDEGGLVIVNVNVDFMSPIFMDDDLVVKSKIFQIGNKSLKLLQVIFDKKSQRIKSVCRTVMCGFDPKANTSFPIKEEWRDMIAAFEPELRN